MEDQMKLPGVKCVTIKFHREEGKLYKGGQFLPKPMRGLIGDRGDGRTIKGGVFLAYVGDHKNPLKMCYRERLIKDVAFWEIWLGRGVVSLSVFPDHFWLQRNAFNDMLVKHFMMRPERVTKMLKRAKCKFQNVIYKRIIEGIFHQLSETGHGRNPETSWNVWKADNMWAASHTGYFLDIQKDRHYFKGRITTPFENTKEKLFNISKIILRIDRGDSKKGHQLCQKPMTDEEKRHFKFLDCETHIAINYRFKVPDIPLTAEIFKMLQLTNNELSNTFRANWDCWQTRNLGIRILAFLNAITNNRKVANPVVNKMDVKEWFDTKVWVWDARTNYYYERE